MALAVVLLAASLAGCIGGDDPGQPPANDSLDASSSTQPDDAVDNGSQQASVGPVESPAWEPGQWWTYRVEHQLGPTTNVTLAVGSVEPGAYQVGWTEPDEGLATLPFHFPPVGTLSRPNLGAWWHGETVSLLDFPLEDGKSWTGSFGDEEVAFTATREGTYEDGPLFTIEATNETGNLVARAQYSPVVGFYTSIERFFEDDQAPSPGVYLKEAGGPSTLDGPVVVPTMTDALDAVVLGPDPTQPQPPVGEAGTFTVENGTDRLVLAGFMGGAPGHYQITWRQRTTGPIVFGHTNGPSTDDSRFVGQVVDDPEGEWEYTIEATGPGLVVAEAIAVWTEEFTPAASAG